MCFISKCMVSIIVLTECLPLTNSFHPCYNRFIELL
nr:MAG TPA: hypothetical protein [Caudoviricetes sp.]